MKNTITLSRPAAAVIGLAALLASAPVFAADVVMEEPPVPAAPMEQPPLATWTGAYAGVNLGYAFSGDTTDDTGTKNSIDTDGFIAGGFVGYNHQFGNIVAGVEGDVGYNWSDGTNNAVRSDSSWEGSLRARLGYTITPDILLYATAGGAAKRLELSDAAGSDKETLLGWTAGAGADMMVTERVFGRVEYRYTDFGSETFNTGLGDRSVDDKDHRIQFGLGLKF